MISVKNCPCCDSEALKNHQALIAPFLSHRIWNRPPFEIALAKCAQCGFLFFNPRLEPDEEERLYAGYRMPEYVKERNTYEPWYTPGLNAKIEGPAFQDRRKAVVREILRNNLDNSNVRTILDYGGAHGELVAELIPGATPYVYDVSQVPPVDGVQSCASAAECRTKNFDLIVCSNVLEHVGQPGRLVDDMSQIANANSAIWIEVPFESPFGLGLTLRRLAQEAMLLCLRPKIGLSLLRPGMLCLMHEHVNFYAPEALRLLLETRGCRVIACETYNLTTPLGPYRMLWALARRR